MIRPDGTYQSRKCFIFYRRHTTDPARFERELKVTIQALGWCNGLQRYLPRQDDLSSVAFWCQTRPGTPSPPSPGTDMLEII